MTDIAELERRVVALEAAQNENTKTLNWVVGTIGRMAADLSAVKEDVKGLRSEVGAMDRRLTEDIAGLRRDLPAIVGEAMRDVLRGEKPA